MNGTLRLSEKWQGKADTQSLTLPTAAGYLCPPGVQVSGKGWFGWVLAAERTRQQHKARSAAGAGMQQLCWRLSWFHALSMLWSLGEDRGSQSPWVMDTLLRKMGMLQGLPAWDLLLLLQRSSWVQKGKDPWLALFIPLFGGQDPGLIFEAHCFYPNIQDLIDGNF